MSQPTEGLLVIVPSRLKKGADGILLLEKAVRSILRQTVIPGLKIDVAVGVDPGSVVPSNLKFPQTVRFVHASAASQASALNTAAKALDHAHLAILEDDDEWHPDFLAVAMGALKRAEFISSTQLQFDARGEIICVFDFPTPSGWVMEKKVWESVGPFNENYRFHLDNEWLGRLAESGAKRAHLVESTAPLDQYWMMLRPWLHNVLTQGGPTSSLLRHQSVIPLVRRLVHEGSGLHSIKVDLSARERSKLEHTWLMKRFGRIPW